MATRFSFQRTDAGWGVKASGSIGEATGLSGRTVEVRRADGKTKMVTLGACLDRWNAGRAAVYSIAGEVKR